MEARKSGSGIDGVTSSALPRFNEGDVLLLDAPTRRLGARACRAVIESAEGDTLRIMIGGHLATRAASALVPGNRVWTAFQHESGVYTFASTIVTRLSDAPLRFVVRIPNDARQLDERRQARRAIRLPVTLFVPGDDGFEVHHTVTDDIGGGGFSCSRVTPMSVGDEIGVSVELPEGPLDAMARLVNLRYWDLPDADPQAHFEFIDLPDGHTERVSRVVLEPRAAEPNGPGPVQR